MEVNIKTLMSCIEVKGGVSNEEQKLKKDHSFMFNHSNYDGLVWHGL